MIDLIISVLQPYAVCLVPSTKGELDFFKYSMGFAIVMNDIWYPLYSIETGVASL